MAAAIDCVVFDIGNVLIRWDPCNLYRRMGYDDATTAAILAETKLLEVNHRELDAGADFAPVISRLSAAHPAHRQFIEAFEQRWIEMLNGPIKDNVRTLQDLKSRGIPVHAISNFSRPKFADALRLFPFLDTFDERIISAEVGMIKPDRDIFELLIARRALDPRRAVFIDNSLPNIEMARSIGFQTVHYHTEAISLAAELVVRGLTI